MNLYTHIGSCISLGNEKKISLYATVLYLKYFGFYYHNWAIFFLVNELFIGILPKYLSKQHFK